MFSYQANGHKKSLGLANPFAPIGPTFFNLKIKNWFQYKEINITQIWNLEMAFKYFTDVSSGGFLKVNWEFDTSWNHADLSLTYCKLSEFCWDEQSTLLRNNQEITIRIIETSVLHVFIGCVKINSNALSKLRITSSCYCHKRFNPIFRLLAVRKRFPTQLVRSCMHLISIEEIVFNVFEMSWATWFEWYMYYWGFNTIKPWTLVTRTRNCESCAAKLLSYEIVWTFLRWILSLRQGTRKCFCAHMISKALTISQVGEIPSWGKFSIHY